MPGDAEKDFDTLLRLLGAPSERRWSDFKRATDIVLVEEGKLWSTGRARASSSPTLPMRWRACKRRSHEHRRPQARAGRAPRLPRSSDTISVCRARRSHRVGRTHRWADPRSRNSLRRTGCCSMQHGTSTTAALKAAWTVLQGGLAVVVSPSLRQSGFLFRKLARHLVASEASFRRETMTEVELVSGGLAVSLPGDRPAMLRGLSLRHDGPAVLIVRDELWATISPMLAAAPAAQQILLSTPAGASGEFHRAWTSGEDWERVQITADQCPRISVEQGRPRPPLSRQ